VSAERTAATRTPHADVRRFLSLLHEPGDIFEVRAPKYDKYRSTASGYFDNIDDAGEAIAAWDGKANLYVTLNPVTPSLLARAVNRINDRADATTADDNIVRRRWLLFDIDPVRPAGISATDSERDQALALAMRIRDVLQEMGWPAPLTACSGNGAYLLYRIDLPNDGDTTALLHGVLAEAARRFDTEGAHVDQTVSNASRIVGLVGTMKMKGDDVADRPHRRSELLDVPDQLVPVDRGLLRAFAESGKADREHRTVAATPGGSEPLVSTLDRHGIEYREQSPDTHGVTWYHVRQCPFHDDGRPFECGVGQKLPDGAYAGHCFHPEGVGRGWREFKQALGLGRSDADRDAEPRPREERDYPLTDAGNGELFADLYGDRFRYDHRRRRWVVWKGDWWSADADGEVRRLAKVAVRSRYLDALSIPSADERLKAARFALQSESRQRLDSLLVQAQTEHPLADAGDRWDSDPLLFGVANGVVDLRTGVLRRGRPEDRITQHSVVRFDPDARCPRFLRFLDEVFGDSEIVDYIQRAIGYSLTGDTREQCLFLCYGTGSNGKSILLGVLRALTGSYGYNAPFSLFELHNRPSIPSDVAALVGRRLVTAAETNEGTRLNEARVKALTGGDTMTARFMYADLFEFVPMAKFWLAVNYKPGVSDQSHGFWRRVRIIPFLRQFEGASDDKTLEGKLLAELPGILAWAVRGALAWLQRGLDPPAAVRVATQEYRRESDPLAQFIDECCVVSDQFNVGANHLFKAYEQWGIEQGLKDRERLNATKFGTQIKTRFTRKHGNGGKRYFGIGLLAEGHFNTEEVTGCDEHVPPGEVTNEGDVTAWVTGLESGDSDFQESLIDGALTREVVEKPVTPRHPVTASACKRCGDALDPCERSNLCEACRKVVLSHVD